MEDDSLNMTRKCGYCGNIFYYSDIKDKFNAQLPDYNLLKKVWNDKNIMFYCSYCFLLKIIKYIKNRKNR